MKNSKKTLLSLFIITLMCACESKSQAGLILDDEFAAIQPGGKNPYGLHGKEGQTVSPITDPRDALLKSEGACALGGGGEMAIGHMIWDNKTYYVTGVEYQSAAQCMENRRSVRAHEKDSKILKDGGICELFLYDDRLKLLTRQKVKLPDLDGGSWCNGSFALGRAKGMDALLYSLMYYTVNTPRAGSIKAIGIGWIRSTYLFQLKKDASGKPYFEQDDSCFGSPNHYETIPDARKALAQCEAKKNVVQ
jgi:hypothetical protein